MPHDSSTPPPSRGLFRLFGLIAPVVVLLAGAGIAVALLGSGTEAKRTRPAQSARLVEVTEVTPTSHTAYVEAWGVATAAQRIDLTSQVTGEVLSLGSGLEPGAQVAAGEPLLTIDPADFELALRQRQADLTRAKAELAQELGQGAVAEQEFKLFSGSVTPAQKRLILREPQLESARASVSSAEAALAKAELDLQRTRINAPFNAVVLEKGIDIGSRVASSTVVATLAGTDRFWVELAVPVAALAKLELPGAKVHLFQEQVWGTERYREGQVVQLKGDLDEKGRMARLLVAVEDPLALHHPDQPPLLLGAFLRAEIEGRPVADALALERSWLRDGDTVWVMTTDHQLAIRQAELLHRGPEQVYVRLPITAGERIVTSDIAIAAVGMPLRTKDEPEAAPRQGEVRP